MKRGEVDKRRGRKQNGSKMIEVKLSYKFLKNI
jgi:hypothetical protein